MGNNAWIAKKYYAEYGNSAVSISWYNPVGQSDDWLVTPLISIPTGDHALEFDNIAPDASYPDNYEVWITTTGNTVNDFLDNGTKIQNSVAANPGCWALKTIDISDYAGQDVYIAFRNVANDKYIMMIDNVVVRAFLQDDARLNSATHVRYSKINTNNSIVYSVTNRGKNAITELQITYSDGTNTVDEIVTANIGVGQTKNITAPTPLNFPTVVELSLSHEITEVNGNVDPNPGDNTVNNSKFNTISEHYDKNTVIEEGTGTWCGWCVRGFIAMDYMQETYDDFIGIAVHNDDPMMLSEYDSRLEVEGYPSAIINRVAEIDVDKNTFVAARNKYIGLETAALVSGDISSNGNEITIIAKAKFNTKLSSNQLRLGVIMAENGVKGTTSGYRQANYYSGGDYGSMGGYENMPDPIPAADMIYNHVGRALLGGFDGQSGSVSANINDGDEVSYTFNYSIPNAYHKNNMYAVVVLIDNETGEIVNAAKYGLAVASTNEIAEAINFEVYPNPANEMVNIVLDKNLNNFTVSIMDLSGKVLMSESVTGNANTVASTSMDVSSLASGSYVISLSTESQSYTKHFVKK